MSKVLQTSPLIPITHRQAEIAQQVFECLDGRVNVHRQLATIANEIGLTRSALGKHLPVLSQAYPQLQYVPYKGIVLKKIS